MSGIKFRSNQINHNPIQNATDKNACTKSHTYPRYGIFTLSGPKRERENKKGFGYLAINQVKLLLLRLTLDREDIGLGETKLEVPSPV